MADLKIDFRALLNKSDTKNDTGALTKNIDLSSASYAEGTLTIGTSQTDFSHGLSGVGQIIFMLVTAGAIVEWGPKITGPDIEDFGQLQDESPFGAVGLKSGATIRLVSDTANTKVQWWAFSK